VALEDIVARILADARFHAEEVLSDAARQAAEIIAAAKSEARARTEADLAQAAGELEAEKNSRLAGVRLAKRAEALALRRELVDGIFAQAERQLTRRSPEEYGVFLIALIPPETARDPATVVLGHDDLRRMGPGFPALVQEALRRQHPRWDATVSREPGDFTAGLSVHTGRSVHNLSLEALLEERRERWELAIAGVLFAP
jgi:vacuolar-type H+-ATPase subunit E/Vma4